MSMKWGESRTAIPPEWVNERRPVITYHDYEIRTFDGKFHVVPPTNAGYTPAPFTTLEDAKAWIDSYVDYDQSPEPFFLAEEVRVTDPETGGQKGSKLAQLGALCPRALMEVAKVAGFGASKYERYNFLKGYRWSLSYDAMQRHFHAFWAGEDFDDESGLYHLAHGVWHGLCLLAFKLRGLGTDDRP